MFFVVQNLKDGKINRIIVLKLDRLTRSIQDLEIICKLIEEYNCSLDSVNKKNHKFDKDKYTLLLING